MNERLAGVSLCMIVKDEERFLNAALDSVAGVVDEICIVDTGSTDRTIPIALAHRARVSEVPWQDDFAHARNAALTLATRRWIFVLDADEQLLPESRPALAALSELVPAQRGKWITCRNLTDDVKGSSAMSNALVRIFPNDPRIRYRNAIHEFIALDDSAGGLPSDTTAIEIVHHGYLGTVVRDRNKAQRNLHLSRIAAQRDPADAFHQYNLGMAFVLAGDPEAAIAALERMHHLTRLAPRGFRVHGMLVLADLYAEGRGDLSTAFALVNECLRCVPNYSNAHFALGKLLARSGNLFAARDAFGRAIGAGAYDREQFVVDNEIAEWKAHSEIGATLMHEGRYAEALAWFELASATRPAAAPLVINRAKCHEALGDMAAARALFSGAFAAFVDEASAIEWINFLLRAGSLEGALDAVDQALPLVGEKCAVLILATASAACLRAGQHARARSALKQALTCGDRPTTIATIRALSGHLAMRELADLLTDLTRVRADGLRIAYASA